MHIAPSPPIAPQNFTGLTTAFALGLTNVRMWRSADFFVVEGACNNGAPFHGTGISPDRRAIFATDTVAVPGPLREITPAVAAYFVRTSAIYTPADDSPATGSALRGALEKMVSARARLCDGANADRHVYGSLLACVRDFNSDMAVFDHLSLNGDLLLWTAHVAMRLREYQKAAEHIGIAQATLIAARDDVGATYVARMYADLKTLRTPPHTAALSDGLLVNDDDYLPIPAPRG